MSEYKPAPWILWVRIVQIVLAVLIMACSAYAASQTWIATGVSFSIFATAWTLIYVPLTLFLLPTLAAHLRPLLITVVAETLSVIWWLNTFALLTSWTTNATFVGYKRDLETTVVKRDHYSDLPHCYSNYDQAKCNAEVAAAYTRWKAASASTKAGTVFAAIELILFVVTLVMVSMQFHRSRKMRLGAGQKV